MKFADKNVLIHEKVQIEVTDCCNLHCFYCPIEQMSHKYMSYELFCSIVDKYKEPTNFLLQGTGESLLHNDFFRMLTYVKSKGHKVKLITNGTVEVTEDILNNLDQIMFSADEFESEKKENH